MDKGRSFTEVKDDLLAVTINSQEDTEIQQFTGNTDASSGCKCSPGNSIVEVTNGENYLLHNDSITLTEPAISSKPSNKSLSSISTDIFQRDADQKPFVTVSPSAYGGYLSEKVGQAYRSIQHALASSADPDVVFNSLTTTLKSLVKPHYGIVIGDNDLRKIELGLGCPYCGIVGYGHPPGLTFPPSATPGSLVLMAKIFVHPWYSKECDEVPGNYKSAAQDSHQFSLSHSLSLCTHSGRWATLTSSGLDPEESGHSGCQFILQLIQMLEGWAAYSSGIHQLMKWALNLVSKPSSIGIAIKELTCGCYPSSEGIISFGYQSDNGWLDLSFHIPVFFQEISLPYADVVSTVPTSKTDCHFQRRLTAKQIHMGNKANGTVIKQFIQSIENVIARILTVSCMGLSWRIPTDSDENLWPQAVHQITALFARHQKGHLASVIEQNDKNLIVTISPACDTLQMDYFPGEPRDVFIFQPLTVDHVSKEISIQMEQRRFFVSGSRMPFCLNAMVVPPNGIMMVNFLRELLKTLDSRIGTSAVCLNNIQAVCCAVWEMAKKSELHLHNVISSSTYADCPGPQLALSQTCLSLSSTFSCLPLRKDLIIKTCVKTFIRDSKCLNHVEQLSLRVILGEKKIHTAPFPGCQYLSKKKDSEHLYFVNSFYLPTDRSTMETMKAMVQSSFSGMIIQVQKQLLFGRKCAEKVFGQKTGEVGKRTILSSNPGMKRFKFDEQSSSRVDSKLMNQISCPGQSLVCKNREQISQLQPLKKTYTNFPRFLFAELDYEGQVRVYAGPKLVSLIPSTELQNVVSEYKACGFVKFQQQYTRIFLCFHRFMENKTIFVKGGNWNSAYMVQVVKTKIVPLDPSERCELGTSFAVFDTTILPSASGNTNNTLMVTLWKVSSNSNQNKTWCKNMWKHSFDRMNLLVQWVKDTLSILKVGENVDGPLQCPIQDSGASSLAYIENVRLVKITLESRNTLEKDVEAADSLIQILEASKEHFAAGLSLLMKTYQPVGCLSFFKNSISGFLFISEFLDGKVVAVEASNLIFQKINLPLASECSQNSKFCCLIVNCVEPRLFSGSMSLARINGSSWSRIDMREGFSDVSQLVNWISLVLERYGYHKLELVDVMKTYNGAYECWVEGHQSEIVKGVKEEGKFDNEVWESEAGPEFSVEIKAETESEERKEDNDFGVEAKETDADQPIKAEMFLEPVSLQENAWD